MQKKPSSCEGCPFYSSGKTLGFVEDDIPSTAKVVLLFDTPDHKFMGNSAAETAEASHFRRTFLPYLGLNPWEVGYSHLIRCKHSVGSKGKKLSDGKDHCRRHDEFTNDSVVVATGSAGWKYFSQNQAGSRKDWRSFFVEVDYETPNVQPTGSFDFTDRSTDGLSDLPGFTE